MIKMILVRGLPGSGKSTVANSMANAYTCHLEADMYFDSDGEYKFDPSKLGLAHQWCQEQCVHQLNINRNVIISNTFTMKTELRPYFEIAKQFNIVPAVIHCQNNFGSIHNVPEETLKKMRDRWENDISELFEELLESQPDKALLYPTDIV